jgi:nucleoside-diphosphate-sugar epimerase
MFFTGRDSMTWSKNIRSIRYIISQRSYTATGEKNPEFAWRVNMKGLRNILDVSTENGLRKVFPSTIAVFGPTTPKVNTPQYTVMEPNTIYGISKQAGERWADYYFQKKGLDIRSIRYPGSNQLQDESGRRHNRLCCGYIL